MQFPAWSRLNTNSIRARLHWATASAVLAVAILLGWIYSVESARIEDGRVAVLQSVVESASGIAASYEKQEREGVLTREAAQRAATTAIGAIRYPGDGYVSINDLQPRMVMHPIKPELNGQDLTEYKDPDGKQLFVAFADMVRLHGQGLVGYLWPRPGDTAPVPKLAFVKGFAPWGWVIVTGVYTDDLATARWRLGWTLAGLGGAVGLVVGVVIFLLGGSVAGPTRKLALITERLAEGDMALTVPGLDRRDELGALARALDVLKANEGERRRLACVATDEAAAKDRRQAAMDRLTQDFGAVISGVLTRLTQAAAKMSDTARELSDGTSRTRDSAALTAEGSISSSRDLATVASATVELSASVDEIARQVAHATGATRDAVGRAEESNATFQRLSTMAERIGSVGGVISSIAAQTNLLALNATIEAARAGEAGKGFAVVANEVKELASQTARATAEISENVTAIRGATEHTATAIREVGAAIERVDAVSAAIAAAIEEQGATTRDIAASVQAVADTSERTAGAMADVAAIVDATGALSQSVLTASDDIGQVADTLRQEVDQFLQTMAQQDVHRRRYERISGNDAPAQIMLRGAPPIRAIIRNISRGGAALGCVITGEAVAEVGGEVSITLPDARVPVGARIVRQGNGMLAVAFRQDARSLAAIDGVLDGLSKGAEALAA